MDFPTLFYKDAKGKQRQWSIQVVPDKDTYRVQTTAGILYK